MVDSGPAVMAKATSKASTTARARRRCARLGDKCERTKCCSSEAAGVFAIGAPPAGQGLERREPILFPVAALHMIPPRLAVAPILPLAAAGDNARVARLQNEELGRVTHTRERAIMCGRRLIDKSFFDMMQHWSGAVMCPAC